MQSPLKLGVFDDHQVVIEGLRGFLERHSNHSLHWSGSTIAELKEQPLVRELDILICDIVNDEVSNYEHFQWLKDHLPNLRIIAYTSLNSTLVVEYLMKFNVQGFVGKHRHLNTLLEAISALQQGELFFPDECSFLIQEGKLNLTSPLTERELEILHLISKECRSSEISEMLNISISTVENHRKNIFKKLAVTNVAGMVRVAAEVGYIK